MKNDVHWIDSIKRLGLAHICVSIREAAIHFECQNKIKKISKLNSTIQCAVHRTVKFIYQLGKLQNCPAWFQRERSRRVHLTIFYFRRLIDFESFVGFLFSSTKFSILTWLKFIYFLETRKEFSTKQKLIKTSRFTVDERKYIGIASCSMLTVRLIVRSLSKWVRCSLWLKRFEPLAMVIYTRLIDLKYLIISLHLALSPSLATALLLFLGAFSFSSCTRSTTAHCTSITPIYIYGFSMEMEFAPKHLIQFTACPQNSPGIDLYVMLDSVCLSSLLLLSKSRCYHFENNFISEIKFALNFTLYTLTHFFRRWSRSVCERSLGHDCVALTSCRHCLCCYCCLFFFFIVLRTWLYSFGFFCFFLMRCAAPEWAYSWCRVDFAFVPRHTFCIFFF